MKEDDVSDSAADVSSPRTAAGRQLLEDLEGLHQPQKALRRILAIEAEAASLNTSASRSDTTAAEVRDEYETLDRKWLTEVRAWTYSEVREALDLARDALAALPAAARAPLDAERLADIIEQAIFETDTGLEAALLAADRIAESAP